MEPNIFVLEYYVRTRKFLHWVLETTHVPAAKYKECYVRLQRLNFNELSEIIKIDYNDKQIKKKQQQQQQQKKEQEQQQRLIKQNASMKLRPRKKEETPLTIVLKQKSQTAVALKSANSTQANKLWKDLVKRSKNGENGFVPQIGSIVKLKMVYLLKCAHINLGPLLFSIIMVNLCSGYVSLAKNATVRSKKLIVFRLIRQLNVF